MRCLAEGVETGRNEALVAMGVEELQGYLIAKPMPASEVSGSIARAEGKPRPVRALAG